MRADAVGDDDDSGPPLPTLRTFWVGSGCRGCGSAMSGASPGGLGLLLLVAALPLLGRRRRHRRSAGPGAAAVLLLALSPAVANAQAQLDVQRLSPAPGLDGTFVATDEARVLGAGGVGAGLLLGYGHRPLQAVVVEDGAVVRHEGVVDGLASAWLRAALSPTDWLELDFSMPVLQVARVGPPLTGGDGPSVVASAGDLQAHARFRLLDDERSVGIAVSVLGTFPTGRPALMLGAGLPTIGAAVVISRRFGPLRVAANVGYQVHPGARSLAEGLVVSDELRFAGGVGLAVPRTPLSVGVEVAGAVTVPGLHDLQVRTDSLAAHRAPAELLA